MENARDFIDSWTAANVRATHCEPNGDFSEAQRLALEFWAEAERNDISRRAIQAAVGDLVEHMADALECACTASAGTRMAG